MSTHSEAVICFVTGGSGYIGRNLIKALVAKGQPVRALARSSASAQKVAALGAEPVMGDMFDLEALTSGMKGARYVVHLAADTSHSGHDKAQEQRNVDSTKTVLAAARAAGVVRALHLSTEAVLLSGQPLCNANEATPYPSRFPGSYSRSKALAEQAALAETTLEVVVVRPRFVWGRDDTTALPALIEASQSGKLAWIGGGQYLTSTTHIDNVIHGVLLALEKGAAGEVYFVTDGAPLPFRTFVSQMLEAAGETPPKKEIPRWVVVAAVRVGELAARLTGGRLKGPMSWQEYATLGVEVTLDTSKAQQSIGYQPVISVEAGMAELAARFSG